jgi:hypothetical protein
MRIEKERNYVMYLSVEEFDLMYPLTKDIPYGYRCITNNEDERESYVITLTDEMLDDIQYDLDRAAAYQEYEKCNRFRAKEIRDLNDTIYYELNYSLDLDDDDDIY